MRSLSVISHNYGQTSCQRRYSQIVKHGQLLKEGCSLKQEMLKVKVKDKGHNRKCSFWRTFM